MENQYKSQPFLLPSCLKLYSKRKDLIVHRTEICLSATCWASTKGLRKYFAHEKLYLMLSNHVDPSESKRSMLSAPGTVPEVPGPFNQLRVHAVGKQNIMRQMPQTQRPPEVQFDFKEQEVQKHS
jgi:hypothetical protein